MFAAHGLTLTAAFEIALACDLIVAARSARFGLVMTGELFGAEELERWNVVNRVFEDDDFERRSRELALKLATGPTRAHAMTKHVVRRYVEGGVAAADEAIRRDAGELFASEDLKGAVKRFLERGPGHAEFNNR